MRLAVTRAPLPPLIRMCGTGSRLFPAMGVCSPLCARVLAGPYGQLALTELDTRKTRPLTDAAAFVASPIWSADGKFVYFASGRGGAINIWKVDARGERPMQIIVGRGDDADMDISADGRRIVFSNYRVSVNLQEILLNERNASANHLTARTWLTSDSARTTVAPIYSRAGKHIAYFTNRRGARGRFGRWRPRQ